MSGNALARESPAAVVEELARRFLAGDRDGAFALFDPQIRIQQPASLPHGGWYSGHAGAEQMGVEFARYWSRTISDTRISGCGAGTGTGTAAGGSGDAGGSGESGDAGELVVQLTTQTWTATSTGRSATVDVVELIRVRAGVIREIRVFQQDTALLLATLDPA
ncbi:nuclear transport factor 2 family protein [Parafrankia sp. EUN1f]|uniref:nuclear transport factor 2 family protein n=1 Tax=Parafrankia sp. EUN1f TaxID=102897 RepID=UPI0001C43A8C|nr:hypothetical protein [Parafrankia sp. EUN1f]EFC83849.1 hypothetical protein FrEUN1fDRAFT_3007 [Parafrankia sp. EUN1f]